MIIRPSLISDDFDKAKLAVALLCRELGVGCNLTLHIMLRVDLKESDREVFVNMAKEKVR